LPRSARSSTVPRPGLGYWAKSRRRENCSRNPFPTPPAESGGDLTASRRAPPRGGPGWSREALKHLAEEGVPVPTALQASVEVILIPSLRSNRVELLEQTGLGVSQLLASKACLAVSVSRRRSSDRGLGILQQIFRGVRSPGLPAGGVATGAPGNQPIYWPTCGPSQPHRGSDQGHLSWPSRSRRPATRWRVPAAAKDAPGRKGWGIRGASRGRPINKLLSGRLG